MGKPWRAHSVSLLPMKLSLCLHVILGMKCNVKLPIKDSSLGNVKIFQYILHPHLGTPPMGVRHTVVCCAELTQSPLVQHCGHC